jgi:hypothetical protein
MAEVTSLEQIITTLTQNTEDLTKGYNGNKAAARRARKALQEVVQLCKVARQELVQISKGERQTVEVVLPTFTPVED